MLPGQENDLAWTGPILRWDEGIPLGNGLCGCLIWGDGSSLRLSLDRGDLWERSPSPGTLRPEFCYRELIRLVRERQFDALQQIFEAPYNCPYPTKLPAGKLLLSLGPCRDIQARLSLDDAMATLRLELEDGPLAIRTFLHAENQAGFLLLDRLPSEFSLQVSCPDYTFAREKHLPEGEMDALATASLHCLTYPFPKPVTADGAEGFLLTIDPKLSYGIFLRRFHTPEGTLLVWKVAAGPDPIRLEQEICTEIAALGQCGFSANLRSHRAWWHTFWSRSGVRISDRLFERNWYLANYLLASCSRKGCPPMPLQGVWTADDGMLPPWKGDFHHDLNTQFSYSHYLKANHLPEGECFLDYLWDLLPAARTFAREFYGADGICLPSSTSLDGQPMCGWAMYAFSPTCQIWLAQLFERYVQFTGDQTFLRERAYPYLRETARCLLSLLTEDADHRLCLPLSSSPEIHGNQPEAWLTPNSNYDLALLRYLFAKLTEFSVQIAPEDTPLWQAALSRLPELAVNETGCYRLSPTEDLRESHRHFAHLMALYPLRLIGYDTPEDRARVDACVSHLERLGTGEWVGFSFPWMAQLYALQQNGEGAAAQLEIFWRYFCSPNGFHLNGDYKKAGFSSWHYRPFTLEANFCAADALQEMLLYSEGDRLRLFPAIPARFQTAAFESFRAQNGLLVSARLEHGKITEVRFQANAPCRILLCGGEALLPVCRGLPDRQIPDGEGNVWLCFTAPDPSAKATV